MHSHLCTSNCCNFNFRFSYLVHITSLSFSISLSRSFSTIVNICLKYVLEYYCNNYDDERDNKELINIIYCCCCIFFLYTFRTHIHKRLIMTSVQCHFSLNIDLLKFIFFFFFLKELNIFSLFVIILTQTISYENSYLCTVAQTYEIIKEILINRFNYKLLCKYIMPSIHFFYLKILLKQKRKIILTNFMSNKSHCFNTWNQNVLLLLLLASTARGLVKISGLCCSIFA